MEGTDANTPCLDTLQFFTGTEASTDEMPALAGHFRVGAFTWVSTAGTAFVDIFLDNVLIRHLEIYRDPEPIALCWGAFEVGIFSFGSGLTISTNNPSVPHGGSLSFLHSVPVNACTEPMWYPDSDWVKIKIVPPGNQLGHLRLGESGPLVDSLTIRAVNFSQVRFVADGRQPHGATETVIVEARVPAANITTQTSFAVACNLQPTNHRQNIGEWITILYGNDMRGRTISKLGCALTSLANALNAFGDTTNPKKLNVWLIDHDGYARTKVSTKLRFEAVNSNEYPRTTSMKNIMVKRSSNFLFMKRENFWADTTSRSELDIRLNDCKLVAVQVYNPSSATHEHWVLVTKKIGADYEIIDPSSPDKTRLYSDYPNGFWGSATVGYNP